MDPSPLQTLLHADDHATTYLKVWAGLVALTGLLVLVSRLGQGYATLGLLTLTPLKAGLVLYFFMHLKDEGLLLRTVVLVTLGTLLIFFALLFADAALR
jgi:cytochrome c oxidase subunit 4